MSSISLGFILHALPLSMSLSPTAGTCYCIQIPGYSTRQVWHGFCWRFLCAFAGLFFQKSLKYHTVDKWFKFLNHKVLVFPQKSPGTDTFFITYWKEPNTLHFLKATSMLEEGVNISERTFCGTVLFSVLDQHYLTAVIFIAWELKWARTLLSRFSSADPGAIKVSGEITTAPTHQFDQS